MEIVTWLQLRSRTVCLPPLIVCPLLFQMHNLQSTSYPPNNSLPVAPWHVCNPLPYDEVDNRIRINYDNQGNQTGQSPTTLYETLNREAHEVPLERNYSIITTGNDPGINYPAERKLPQPTTDQQCESHNTSSSIQNETVLKEDQDGYLAPEITHTYFTLDKSEWHMCTIIPSNQNALIVTPYLGILWVFRYLLMTMRRDGFLMKAFYRYYYYMCCTLYKKQCIYFYSYASHLWIHFQHWTLFTWVKPVLCIQ